MGGGVSSGTIAALILAGFLGFIVLSGCLCFFVVIRPRRRRKHSQAARARRARPKDPGNDVIDQILDIRPPVEARSPTSSKKSGFARWKNEVEGGYNTQNIGIVFRKSNSGGDNRQSNGKLSLAPSNHSKDKKTSPISESSWSPSFMLELPIRPTPSYEESDKDQDISVDGVLQDAPFAMTPLSSLSYITPPPISRHPPSYADSNSSAALPRSVPRTISRSVSNFTPSPIQDRVVNEFLLDEGPNIRASEVQSVGDSGQVITSPPEQDNFPPSPTSQEDQGSTRHSSEDATSGVNLAQMALLGLHTRTLEHSRPHRMRSLREREQPRDSLASSAFTGGNLHIHPISAFSETASSEHHSSFLEMPSPVRLHHSDPEEQSTREEDDGFFLEPISATSFRVNFSGASPRGSVDTDQTRPPDTGRTRTSISRQLMGPRLRSVFRITPPSLPPSPAVAALSSTDSARLTTSSDISDYSRSFNPTDSSGHDHHLAPPSQRRLERLNSPTRADRAPETIPSPSISPGTVFSSPVAPPVPHIPSPAAATTFQHELVSYIDFTTSCDVSQRTHSIAPTESSGLVRSRVVSSQQPSRLSNPIVPDFDESPPLPLPPPPPPPPPPPSTLLIPPPTLLASHPSLSPHPPASHQHPTSPPRLTPRALPRLIVPNPTRPTNSPRDSDTTSAPAHAHPPLFLSPSSSGSPTVSFSEIRFRRGDSMSEELRPLHADPVSSPHPPSSSPGSSVPTPPNPAQSGLPAAMPSPGPASYIVQHVLGKTAGSSSSVNTHRQGRP